MWLVFDEGSIEEKRFFLRSFLSKIELDPVSCEGEARFTLLPGLNKLWQPANSAATFEVGTARTGESLPNMAQKNPENRAMSSGLLVAGARYVQEKKT